MLVVNSRIQIPLKELRFTFSRSQGPGGQNVNKVNTKATLRWKIGRCRSLPEDVRARFHEKFKRRISSEGDFIMTSQRFRDQGRNVADCLEKLRAMLTEVAVAKQIRKPTKPSRAARERRLKQKHEASSKKKQRRTRPRLDD